jgi:tRNA nucleotidyltransferase (CCA-adding enzyme)
MTLGEAGELFERQSISGAPVERDGEISGIVSRRDVRRAARSNNLDLPVASHMSHELVSVDQQEPVEDVLALMTRHDVGRLPVTRDGEVVGLVTRTDIIRALYMKAWDDVDL